MDDELLNYFSCALYNTVIKVLDISHTTYGYEIYEENVMVIGSSIQNVNSLHYNVNVFSRMGYCFFDAPGKYF